MKAFHPGSKKTATKATTAGISKPAKSKKASDAIPLSILNPPPQPYLFPVGSLVPAAVPPSNEQRVILRQGIRECKELIEALSTVRRFELQRSCGKGVCNVPLVKLMDEKEESLRAEMVELMKELGGQVVTLGEDAVGCRDWIDD
ncbi:hypothetical protein KEM56_007414 [Ascosphaera pollenicola]|nr:hypothetical protein KEM56_007414 [Ascosphaera pollenicola]